MNAATTNRHSLAYAVEATGLPFDVRDGELVAPPDAIADALTMAAEGKITAEDIEWFKSLTEPDVT